MATQHYNSSRGLSERARQAQGLLERYPDISEGELASLIRTFAQIPLLDFGIMAADERLGDKLTEFHSDHGDKLRPPLPGIVWAIAVPVLIVGIALAYALVT